MNNVVSIFSRKPPRCATCGSHAMQQCGVMLHGVRCGRLVCARCASSVAEIVYCPTHARAAGLRPKTPPAPLMPVLGKVVAR